MSGGLGADLEYKVEFNRGVDGQALVDAVIRLATQVLKVTACISQHTVNPSQIAIMAFHLLSRTLDGCRSAKTHSSFANGRLFPI